MFKQVLCSKPPFCSSPVIWQMTQSQIRCPMFRRTRLRPNPQRLRRNPNRETGTGTGRKMDAEIAHATAHGLAHPAPDAATAHALGKKRFYAVCV